MCWVFKGGAILTTGVQPPLLLDLGAVLMAAATLALAQGLLPSRHRTVCAGAAGLALVCALPALTGEIIALPDVITGTGAGAAALLTLLALGVGGSEVRRQQGALLPLVVAVATIPALVVGGLLATVAGERTLEVPIVALGAAWVAIGLSLLRQEYQAS